MTVNIRLTFVRLTETQPKTNVEKKYAALNTEKERHDCFQRTVSLYWYNFLICCHLSRTGL